MDQPRQTHTAAEVWEALDEPWQLAFEEAWVSWQAGNFGIGAVLVELDDSDGARSNIVSRGRNRVNEQATEVGTIAGNFMAHAEMNAYSALTRFNAKGLHLYTTLEPCLMCAATTMMLNVEHVHFAAADEFFVGLEDLWPQFPYSAERQPARSGPLVGKLANFARVLPTSFTMLFNPADHPVVLAAYAANLGVAELAAGLLDHEGLSEAKGGTALDALTALWPDLPEN